MISKFMIATFVAAALAGCASDDTRPTHEDRLAQCEASCAAMDGTFESLDQEGCVCLKTEARDPDVASFDNRCTVSGCVGVCGAGLCVNASSNNSGGCNYYCLAPSVEPEPEPEPEPVEPGPSR